MDRTKTNIKDEWENIYNESTKNSKWAQEEIEQNWDRGTDRDEAIFSNKCGTNLSSHGEPLYEQLEDLGWQCLLQHLQELLCLAAHSYCIAQVLNTWLYVTWTRTVTRLWMKAREQQRTTLKHIFINYSDVTICSEYHSHNCFWKLQSDM